MKNFNKQSKVVTEITSKIESFNSEYSFYSIRFTEDNVTMQGRYDSSIVRRLDKDYETSVDISSGGYIVLNIKNMDINIKLVLT